MDCNEIRKVSMALLPSPLEEAFNLSKELGQRIFIKRDDGIGPAFGGSKTRKLEFLFGEAVGNGCNVVITGGRVNSNHARLTTAFARRLGMSTILLLRKGPVSNEEPPVQGNLLVDKILGADIRFMDKDMGFEEIEIEMDRIANELKDKGKRPYVIPTGGSSDLGALGYYYAFKEIEKQLPPLNDAPTYLISASGAGGTQAGLVLGSKAFKSNITVVGINIAREHDVTKKRIHSMAQGAAELLKLDVEIQHEDVNLRSEYLGEGYSIPTNEGISAIKTVARLEGLILEHTYTGKAMAGLIDLCKKGEIEKGSNIVFLNTGGMPGLFTRPLAYV